MTATKTPISSSVAMFRKGSHGAHLPVMRRCQSKLPASTEASSTKIELLSYSASKLHGQQSTQINLFFNSVSRVTACDVVCMWCVCV